jgi:hypothetical protein
MVQIAGLTVAGLLDRVEDTLRRTAIGRMSVPARAYAADAAGRVTVFAFPVPADDAGRQALGAILDAELAKRRAVLCVLTLESWAVVGRPGTDGAGAAAPLARISHHRPRAASSVPQFARPFSPSPSRAGAARAHATKTPCRSRPKRSLPISA